MKKTELLKNIGANIINMQTLERLTPNNTTRRAYRAYIFDMSMLAAHVRTTNARTREGRAMLEDYAERMSQHMDSLKNAMRIDYYARFKDFNDYHSRIENEYGKGLLTFDEYKTESVRAAYIF